MHSSQFHPFCSCSSSDTCHYSSRNALLLGTHCDLDGDARLRRESHLDLRRDLPARDALAIQFEGVGRVGESDVAAVERLEGECGGKLFCCVCCSGDLVVRKADNGCSREFK